MDSIVSNITGGFLNDILKATSTECEHANYQNIILPQLSAAVAKYCDFKEKILLRLRVPKNQPTIKEAFTKCERDVFVKKLSDQEAVLKDCFRLNQQTSEKIDYFMRIKMQQVVERVSPLESAHQKAREYVANEQEAPKVVEETPNIQITITENDVKFAEEVADETPEVEETTDAEQASNGEETTDEVKVEEETTDEVEETTEEVEETTEEVEETTEEVEETTEEVEAEEEEVEAEEEEVEETTDAEQAPNGEVEAEEEVEVAEEAPDATGADAVEEDVSEEEIEVEEEEEEEVEEYTHKGKKYYVTNTTNGKIYACTTDDDIGDQVGSFKNGKPIFS